MRFPGVISFSQEITHNMAKQSKTNKSNVLKEAWSTYYKGDFDAALQLFDQVVKKNKDVSARYGKACTLFRTADHEGAIEQLNALIKEDASNPDYYHTRAMVHGASEDYKRARKDLEKLTVLEPSNGEAWCDLGGLHLVMGDYKEAAVCFERSADADKRCACAWMGKGLSALFAREYKKAIDYLDIALKLDKKNGLAIMARAESYFAGKKEKEALKDLKQLLAMDSEFKERFLDVHSEELAGNADG